MESTTAAPSKKIILNTGLYLGLASIVLSVVLYLMNMHTKQNMVTGLIGLALIAVFVIYGISQYKKANGQLLSVGQALKVGVGVAVVGGLISVIYTLIFMYVIEPEFMSQMADIQRDKMLESNPDMTEEQLKSAMAIAAKFSSPGVISAISLVFSAFFGFIFALIGGLIMKNDRN